jgi:DNA-binding MarR family transcriptional regulator
MPRERLFFTGSTRIISDPRPSGLDLRVYACVSLHDGMSLLKGTGRGCYATFATLTAEIGCDAANLSRSLKRLVEWGYLTEERQTDRRRKTYRVTFESAESWQVRQRSAVHQTLEIVGNALSENGANLPQTDQHYSSLKGLDLPKDKLDSSKEARFARGHSSGEFADNVGSELAKLERAMDAGAPLNRLEAYDWIGETAFVGDRPDYIRHWALRVADKLVDAMTDAEHSQWREHYGCGETAA